MRLMPNFSFKKTVPIIAAKSTDVSRNADTDAIAPSLSENRTNAYAITAKTPPVEPDNQFFRQKDPKSFLRIIKAQKSNGRPSKKLSQTI